MTTRRPCDHCGLRPWSASWTVRLCANKRRPKVAKLCRECDVELNAWVLRFVRHPMAEELVRDYVASGENSSCD